MAQFRTTADLVDAVLNRSGETTSGTSPYEADALTYLNKIHSSLVGGGLVFDVTVDDDWEWAKSRHPYTIELQPKHNTGTITLTQGSDAGTFSSAPSASLEGWFLRESGNSTLYRIIQHTAASTAFEIDAFYVGTTGASKSYEAFKLDYQVLPSHIYIESGINDRIDFVRTGSTEVNANITPGAYTPSALATHVAAVIQAAAGGTSTYGCTYDSVTRKFTLTSNRQSSDVFYVKWATGTNASRSIGPSLGFDYTDGTNAASHVSTYVLGGVSRIVSPVRCYRSNTYSRDIDSLDRRMFDEEHPLWKTNEGIPRKFTIVREESDGLLTIRFDRYSPEKMKVEIQVIPVPLDLKDNTASIPLVPRKYADILEFGAASFVLLDKEDDKAESYKNLAAAQINLMQSAHRAQLRRSDSKFGELISRPEQLSTRRLRYGYDSIEE